MTKCEICGKPGSYKHVNIKHGESLRKEMGKDTNMTIMEYYKKKYHLKSVMPNHSEKVRTANIAKKNISTKKWLFVDKNLRNLEMLFQYKSPKFITKKRYAELLHISLSKVNKDISANKEYFPDPKRGFNKGKEPDLFRLDENLVWRDINKILQEEQEDTELVLKFIEEQASVNGFAEYYDGKTYNQIIKSIESKAKENDEETPDREAIRYMLKKLIERKELFIVKKGNKKIYKVVNSARLHARLKEVIQAKLSIINTYRSDLYKKYGYMGGDKTQIRI